jgi:hypothetical protein
MVTTHINQPGNYIIGVYSTKFAQTIRDVAQEFQPPVRVVNLGQPGDTYQVEYTYGELSVDPNDREVIAQTFVVRPGQERIAIYKGDNNPHLESFWQAVNSSTETGNDTLQ